MLSKFYKHYSVHLLVLVALSFPYLAYKAESIRSNNDIETWLPKQSDVRSTYEQFKHDFGIEEGIVIGIDTNAADGRLIEALAGRIDDVKGVRKCWTPTRLQEVMGELGVTEEDAQNRLRGLVISDRGQLHGLVIELTEEGLKDRAGTVTGVRRELAYCQLDGHEICLTGAPVIVTELDRLGSQAANRQFFLLTLVITLGLLYYSIGHWGMSFALLGITLWSIYATTALIAICGGEMNFILGALSIMVMIFTLSVSIHFLSYYSLALQEGAADPLGLALTQSWNPCLLSTFTTLIGLVSLNVSSILPVTQFGYAAGLGSVVAFGAGLGLTPALLVLYPNLVLQSSRRTADFGRLGHWVIAHNRPILAFTAVVLVVTTIGLVRLESKIDPVGFLPKDSKVVADLKRVSTELTNIDSIEGVVDFTGQDLPFLSRIEKVRALEAKIRQHPSVRHTISLASFFPEKMPESALGNMRLLKQAQSRSGDNSYLADGDRKWRISARIGLVPGKTPTQIFTELTELTAGEPIKYTGITPLLEGAQREIFTGFWQSFSGAFITISLVMVLSLRSLRAGTIAMIPNLIPIWLVFGVVGFMGMTVDIGMMMTGSIAIGISVDCTFHFLVRYQEVLKQGKTNEEAVIAAIEHTGEPMLDSAIVGSLGMMALGLSNFAPTARFGYLMAAQMMASLLGELVLLPAMLTWRRKSNAQPNLQVVEAEAPRPVQMRRRAHRRASERVA
jgi:predicted RND superfamily exporter protein